MSYCAYYQARVVRKDTWLLVSFLRSHEHVAFDRTLDKDQSLFEFFVPLSQEELFCKIMNSLEKKGIVYQLTKLPNRLEHISYSHDSSRRLL